MRGPAAHLSAAVSGARAGFDAYRERLVLGSSSERFARALAAASPIEGFTTPAELSLLYHLAAAAPGPGSVVEIGSYLGRSTVVLAHACADTGTGPVVAVDPHTAALGIDGRPPRDTREEFLANLARAGMSDDVRLVHTTSVEAAARWDGGLVRMQFVDGWHSREAVLEDVRSWAPSFTEAPTVVFDDFMVSEGVRRAVRDLQAEGVLPPTGVVAGKMAAFGPDEVLGAAPLAPGARLLGRLSDQRLERLIRLAGG